MKTEDLKRLLFRDRREQLGLKQRDFEERVGWRNNALSLIENGTIRPEESQWNEMFAELEKAEAERGRVAEKALAS